MGEQNGKEDLEEVEEDGSHQATHRSEARTLAPTGRRTRKATLLVSNLLLGA